MTPATVISPRPGVRRRRPLLRAVAAACAGVLTIALTGCMKIDINLTIKDDAVSGTMILAFDRQLLTITGQSEEQMLAALNRDSAVPEGEGITAERYADDTFIGYRYTLTKVALAEFAQADADEDSLRILHDKDAGVYRLTGAMDLSQVEAVPQAMRGIMDSIEVKIAVTFPGEVIRHTGELDGTTVTWRPALGERTLIEAEAKDSAGSWLATAMIGGSLLLALVVVVVVVFALLRRRPGTATPGEPGPQMPGPQMPGPQHMPGTVGGSPYQDPGSRSDATSNPDR